MIKIWGFHQTRNTLKGDWVEIVKKDLQDFKINESFDEIAKIKENVFKKRVTKACRTYSFNKLMEIKERKEKGRNLVFDQLKIQPYLYSDKLNSKEAIFLFKIRSQMLEVRKNFEKMYMNDMICQVCLSHCAQ